jgi:hypothetical protein
VALPLLWICNGADRVSETGSGTLTLVLLGFVREREGTREGSEDGSWLASPPGEEALRFLELFCCGAAGGSGLGAEEPTERLAEERVTLDDMRKCFFANEKVAAPTVNLSKRSRSCGDETE